MQTANCASSSSTLAWCLSGAFSKSPIRQIFLFQKLKTLQLKSGSTLYGNKTAVFTICSARRRRRHLTFLIEILGYVTRFSTSPSAYRFFNKLFKSSYDSSNISSNKKKKCDFCFLPVTSRFLRLNTKLTAHISYTHIEDDVQRRMNFQ